MKNFNAISICVKKMWKNSKALIKLFNCLYENNE